MTFRAVHRQWQLGFLASSLSWLAAPDADACSCLNGARLNWPAGNQTDVPLDTSVIVTGFGGFEDAVLPVVQDAGTSAAVAADGGASDVAPLPSIEPAEHPPGLYLVSATGKVVELALERTRATVDCISSYRFFRQVSGELEADSDYHIYDGQTFVATFTTGTQRRDIDAEIAEAKAFHFETLGTTDQPSRITTAYLDAVPSQLTFVHYTGSQQEVTYRLSYLSEGVAAYDFGTVECPVVEFLGMDGAVLDERKLCEPDRCMAHPNEVSISSCGGNYAVGVNYAEFTMLPACSDTTDTGNVTSTAPSSAPPPTSTSNSSAVDSLSAVDSSSSVDASVPSLDVSAESSTDDEPGPNKVPINSSARSDGGGCTISGGEAKTSEWLVGLVLMGFAARRTRRHGAQA